jgi:hypothetical protein
MRTVLFNPFEKYSDTILIVFGLIFTLIGSCLGFVFNTRFDGVLDLHFVKNVSIYNLLLDISIDILTLTICLFVIGKLINNKTRLIDILSATMIARIPFYFITFFNVNNKAYTISERILTLAKSNQINTLDTLDTFYLVLMTFAIIASLIWSMVLLFNGFKTATNAKEIKDTLFFIGALIAAEILSKILILTLD